METQQSPRVLRKYGAEGGGGILRATEGMLKTVWSEGQLSKGQLRSDGAKK